MNHNLRRLVKNIKPGRILLYYSIISVLTILVLFPDLFFFIKNNVVNYAVSGFFIVQLLLLIPVVIFCRRLKIYYWILAFLVALIPVMILSVIYMNIQVNAEMVGLVLDTDKEEVTELFGWKIFLLIGGMIFCFWLFLKLAYRLPEKISWKNGLVISLIGFLGFLVIPLMRTTDVRYYISILNNTYKTFYPFRIQSVFSLLNTELNNMKNYQKTTKDFKFNAVDTDSADGERKVFLLIIGETARGDHFHINGYERETSPGIESLTHLVSFKDAVTGGTMTIVSVPQLITRATPENYSLHTKEKSILSAFKEAGYYTAWISNQSKYGLSGNIGMHVNDGDTSIYSGHGENETNFTGSYDETILPILSNLMNQHSSRNIFAIVHLIGSHWRYILRYPPEFSKFKPTSDRNRLNLINPTKEMIVNEYDNSILYTDHILKSIADTLKKFPVESAFLYVSDHGENLNEKNDNTYFHSFKPDKYTAGVPLFVWLNPGYAQKNAEILKNLKDNSGKKVNTALNVFYTMIDIGKLSISGFNDSASLARKTFVPAEQTILGDESKLYHYDQLK